MTKDLMRGFSAYFESRVDVPRIQHGFRQTLETLINEEALLIVKLLRNECEIWTPRIVIKEL